MLKFLQHFWIEKSRSCRVLNNTVLNNIRGQAEFARTLLVRVLFAGILLANGLLFGCSGANEGYDAALSPKPVTATLSSYNEGSTDLQFIQLVVAFDREITAIDLHPKLKIAGENAAEKDMMLSASGKELTLTLHVDKIRDGDLTLRFGTENEKNVPGLTDAGGTHGAAPFSVEGLVPSGVTLTQTARDDDSVTVDVTRTFNIRSIAWVRFTDDGTIAGDSLLNGADERDGAIALHGHEFLTDDAYDIAAELAETLSAHFGDRYEFVADGTSVTAKRKDGAPAQLDITIYSDTKIL